MTGRSRDYRAGPALQVSHTHTCLPSTPSLLPRTQEASLLPGSNGDQLLPNLVALSALPLTHYMVYMATLPLSLGSCLQSGRDLRPPVAPSTSLPYIRSPLSQLMSLGPLG